MTRSHSLTLPAIFLGLSCLGTTGCQHSSVTPTSVPPVGASEERVVYVADAEIPDRLELYSVRLDGTGLVKLSHPLPASEDIRRYWVSPDGETVAYVTESTTSDFFLVNADGSDRLQLPLSGFGSFCWAADSSRAALLINSGNDGGLYTVKRDGNGLVELSVSLAPQRYVRTIEWSPDSQWIAIVVRGDGKRDTLYSAAANGTFFLDISVGATTSDEARIAHIAWAPDASRVAIAMRPGDDYDEHLYTAYPDGSGTPTLASPSTERGGVQGMEWSPDSTRLLYHRLEMTTNTLAVTTPDGPNPHAVLTTKLTGGFDWSPDGAWVSYVAYEPSIGARTIYVSDDAGNSNVVSDISPVTQFLDAPKWSPDSRWLSFLGDFDVSYRRDLFIAEATGATLPVNLSDATAVLPFYQRTTERTGWTSTGRLLFATHPDASSTEYDLRSIDPEASATQIVLDPTFTQSGIYGWFCEDLSFIRTTDDARVVYLSIDPADGSSRLCVVAADGSGTPIVVSGPFAPMTRGVTSFVLPN